MSDVVSCSISVYLVLCTFAVSFSSVSVDGNEKKAAADLCSFVFFGHNLSRSPPSSGVISHSKHFKFTKSSSQHFASSYQSMSTNICFNKLLLRKARRQKVALFFQMVIPSCFCFLTFFLVASLIYPAYNDENADGKLLIAIFAPLAGVFVKVTSLICVQKLYNITHPGYSYVFLSPLYCGAAIVFRILQADLGSLVDIAILGIVHGAAEVIERSTIVLLDHIVHTMCRKKISSLGKLSYSSS